MEILISNEQDDVPVDEDSLTKLADFVLHHENVKDTAELSIALINEERIRELNAAYRGKDVPTDVLSFESGDVPDETEPYLLGDVVICPSVAKRQAEEFGQTLEQELGLLLTHGILHLLGYDHQTEEEAEAMEAREREILSLAHGEKI